MFCIGRAFECEICLVPLCAEGPMELQHSSAASTGEFLPKNIFLPGEMGIFTGILFGAFRSLPIDFLYRFK